MLENLFGNEKIRIAYLGRVSTLLTSQDSSLTNQKDNALDFIRELIKSNSNFIFDENTDCFEDRITGTKLKKYNDNEQGVDRLLELCNFEINDIKTNDYMEVSIKVNRAKKSKYQLIITKSTSRITRAGSSGNSLLNMLKDNGVYVYFYDIRESTKTMHPMTLLMQNYMDNQYSKGVSYNTRMSRLGKTKYKQIMVAGRRYGWNIKPNTAIKEFEINKEEHEVIKYIFNEYLNTDKGTTIITNELIDKGIKTHTGKPINVCFVARLLKDRRLLGEEQYYDFSGVEEEYIAQFCVGRDYLKQLPKQWKKCDYIPQLIDEETFNAVQEKLKGRAINGRGVRFPLQEKSKKLECGVCGKHYFSKNITNYYNERCFCCSSNRKRKELREIDCKSFTFYEPFLDEYLEKKSKNLRAELKRFYYDYLVRLMNLRYHIVLLLDKDTTTDYIELLKKKDELNEEIQALLEKSIKLDLKGSNAIDELILKKDQELEEVQANILKYEELETFINDYLIELNEMYNILIEEYANIKDNYTKEECFQLLKKIIVYPKNTKKITRNRVFFISVFNIEYRIFDMFKRLLQRTDLMKLLDEKTIKQSEIKHHKAFYVRPLTKEKEERAKELLERLGY